jgi:hypothetical protein
MLERRDEEHLVGGDLERIRNDDGPGLDVGQPLPQRTD